MTLLHAASLESVEFLNQERFKHLIALRIHKLTKLYSKRFLGLLAELLIWEEKNRLDFEDLCKLFNF